MKAKNFIKYFFIFSLAFLFIPALIVFIVDPLSLYHKQINLNHTTYYFKEQRHQNIGLINYFLKRSNENYNTIIIGTSMSENFRASLFEKELNDGSKVLNLTMSGARPLEQYILIKKALDTKKIKRVFWDIHWYFLLKKINQKDKNHDFPYKLYSDNIFQQAYYYLFNEDYVKDSINIFLGKINKKKWSKNLDKLNYHMDEWVKQGIFKKFHSNKNINKLNREIYKIKKDIPINYKNKFTYPDLDKYLLSILKKYSNVEFYLFFPPYSTYFYAKNPVNKSLRYINARKYLIEKTKNLKNVKIFGFDNEFDIVNNIYNYKDYGHYRDEINNIMMRRMIKNKNRLTTKNINIYINNMINNINSYSRIFYKKVIK